MARHDGDCRGFFRRREAEPGDAPKQRSHPVRKGRIVDLDGNDDWRGLLAHVSGLSPIVNFSRTGSPARRTVTFTAEPTLSGPSACNSDRTPEILSSFHSTITSPCRMPAADDGPDLSTFITIAPTPSSSLTGSRP